VPRQAGAGRRAGGRSGIEELLVGARALEVSRAAAGREGISSNVRDPVSCSNQETGSRPRFFSRIRP